MLYVRPLATEAMDCDGHARQLTCDVQLCGVIVFRFIDLQHVRPVVPQVWIAIQTRVAKVQKMDRVEAIRN